jgi:hypothetical protein
MGFFFVPKSFEPRIEDEKIKDVGFNEETYKLANEATEAFIMYFELKWNDPDLNRGLRELNEAKDSFVCYPVIRLPSVLRMATNAITAMVKINKKVVTTRNVASATLPPFKGGKFDWNGKSKSLIYQSKSLTSTVYMNKERVVSVVPSKVGNHLVKVSADDKIIATGSAALHLNGFFADGAKVPVIENVYVKNIVDAITEEPK